MNNNNTFTKYIARDGVIMSLICGRQFLIPTRKAYEDGGCVIMPVSLIQAGIWMAISGNKGIETAYKLVAALQHKTPDEEIDIVDKIIEDLCEKGYIVKN